MKKSILITGAYGGMGKATQEAFRDSGYQVFALDKTVNSPIDGVIPIEADLTDENSIRDAFCRVRENTDNLCAIIHFAGIYMLDSLVEMESAAFETIFKVNLESAFLVNKIFLPLLTEGSHIVITTSELAVLDPLPFTGIYALTKGALDKYAYSLRMELQLKGIAVSVVRAGAVDTGMLGASMAALERFHKKTELYECNAARFKRIVESVEARSVSTKRISSLVMKIVEKKNPRFTYSINRNPLLMMLNLLPKRMQLWIIKMVLK